MPKLSPKEQCFKDAVEKYEDLTGEKTGVEIDKAWEFNTDTGQWETGRGWWHALGRLLSLAKPTEALRRPDITINGERVLDLKFTRPSNGAQDTWGTETNTFGNTQRDDYETINEQNGHGSDNDPEHGPGLNPDRCGCGPQAQRQTVPATEPVTVPAPIVIPYQNLSPAWQNRMTLPGLGPRGLGLGGRIPLRVPLVLPN